MSPPSPSIAISNSPRPGCAPSSPPPRPRRPNEPHPLALLVGAFGAEDGAHAALSAIEARSPANGIAADPATHGTDPDRTVVRLLLPRPIRSATLNGQPLPTPASDQATPLLTLPASSTPQRLTITF